MLASGFLQPPSLSGEKLEPEGCIDPFTWDITFIPRDPSRGQMKSRRTPRAQAVHVTLSHPSPSW